MSRGLVAVVGFVIACSGCKEEKEVTRFSSLCAYSEPGRLFVNVEFEVDEDAEENETCDIRLKEGSAGFYFVAATVLVPESKRSRRSRRRIARAECSVALENGRLSILLDENDTENHVLELSIPTPAEQCVQQ